MLRASIESIAAFVEAAALGSFSAAARRLGKSQSTISEAIARLEIDLDVALFDRSTRQPTLTEAGRHLLGPARELLDSGDRLGRLAGQIGAGLEARLTIVTSDTYQSPRYDAMLRDLDRRHPTLEFECLIAEGQDVIALLQSGRAQIGVMQAEAAYPPGIAAASAADAAEIGLFVAKAHPLAALPAVTREELARHRELRLQTYADAPTAPPATGRCWSAASYLLLMEMAQQGYGWAPLPCWMVASYDVGRRLVGLAAPGFPRTVPTDVVWSERHALGAAGHWAVQALRAGIG